MVEFCKDILTQGTVGNDRVMTFHSFCSHGFKNDSQGKGVRLPNPWKHYSNARIVFVSLPRSFFVDGSPHSVLMEKELENFTHFFHTLSLPIRKDDELLYSKQGLSLTKLQVL